MFGSKDHVDESVFSEIFLGSFLHSLFVALVSDVPSFGIFAEKGNVVLRGYVPVLSGRETGSIDEGKRSGRLLMRMLKCRRHVRGEI